MYLLNRRISEFLTPPLSGAVKVAFCVWTISLKTLIYLKTYNVECLVLLQGNLYPCSRVQAGVPHSVEATLLLSLMLTWGAKWHSQVSVNAPRSALAWEHGREPFVDQQNSAGARVVLGGFGWNWVGVGRGGGGLGMQLLGLIQSLIPRLHGPDSGRTVSLVLHLKFQI